MLASNAAKLFEFFEIQCAEQGDVIPEVQYHKECDLVVTIDAAKESLKRRLHPLAFQ